MVDEKYIVRVKEHPEHLPWPRLRRPLLKEDRCEKLHELGIISIKCELNEV